MSEERKNILLVTRPICPPWDEASKNFAYFLAKSISRFRFYLLTHGHLEDLPDNVIEESIYGSAHFSYREKLSLMGFLYKVQNKVDILHFLFTPTKANAFFAKYLVGYGKNSRTRKIQTVATLREDLYSDRELKKLIFGDLIITYSDHAKQKLNSLGFENVERIYPGVDIEKYSPKEKDTQIMKQFDIHEKDLVITYPGEYTRLNATDSIVEVLIKNKESVRALNIKFIFACRIKNEPDQDKKNEIDQLFQKEGIAQNIVYTDTFPDMEKIFNLSDIVVFPVQDMRGKFDVPLAVIEAMACAKPVIISDLPILREFSNSENSVMIPTGNLDIFWKNLFDLAKNPALRKTLGQSARQYAENNFNIRQVAGYYEKIYERLSY